MLVLGAIIQDLRTCEPRDCEQVHDHAVLAAHTLLRPSVPPLTRHDPFSGNTLSDFSVHLATQVACDMVELPNRVGGRDN